MANILILQPDPPGCWPVIASDNIEQGCLAGPVWPDQTGDAARRDGQAGIVNCPHPAKIHAHIFRPDHLRYTSFLGLHLSLARPASGLASANNLKHLPQNRIDNNGWRQKNTCRL